MVGAAILPQPQGRTLAIVSGAPHVVLGATIAIQHAGFIASDSAETSLVVDAPVGFALHALKHRALVGRHVIVTTTNTCPEYVEDVWDYRPDALLAGQNLTHHIYDVMASIDAGKLYRLTPGVATRLTLAERHVLRLLARGWNNAAIARHLNVQPQTVANTLTQVYAALDTSGREATMLHYWGIFLSTD